MKRTKPVLAILVFAVVMILYTAVVVYAEDGRGGTGQILVIMEGDSSPISGILLSEDVYREYLQLELDLEREQLRNKMLHEELEATKTAMMLQIRKCQDERDDLAYKLANPSFFKRPEVNRWIGFGLGVAVTSVAVKGAGELK